MSTATRIVQAAIFVALTGCRTLPPYLVLDHDVDPESPLSAIVVVGADFTRFRLENLSNDELPVDLDQSALLSADGESRAVLSSTVSLP